MQLKKSFSLLFATLVVVAILASACGGENSTNQESTDSELQTTIPEGGQVITTSVSDAKVSEDNSAIITDEATPEAKEVAEVVEEIEEEPKVEKVIPKKVPKKRAKMVFEGKLHDYGFVMQGDTVTHDFYFKNVGNDNLVITKVKPSCGCTVPVYPKKPIAPGESGKIEVIFKTAGKLGRQVPSIDVYTNYKRKIKLELKGFVDAERAKPPQIKIEEDKGDVDTEQ